MSIKFSGTKLTKDRRSKKSVAKKFTTTYSITTISLLQILESHRGSKNIRDYDDYIKKYVARYNDEIKRYNVSCIPMIKWFGKVLLGNYCCN